MQKISQLLTFGTLIFLLAPYYTLAQISTPESLTPPEIPTRFFSCYSTDTLRQCILRLLGDILRVILVIALTGAALVIAWAGIQYITGLGGEKEDARKSAKNKIIYAAVGLVVAFLAWVLTVMISRWVGGAAL